MGVSEDGVGSKRESTASEETGRECVLRVKKLRPSVVLPRRGSLYAAGYDLCSDEDCVVEARSRLLVATGLAMAIPKGYYGRVAPRSGLASKRFIDTGAGVIDADYRGEVKVLLFNFGEEAFPSTCEGHVFGAFGRR
mmetsp:Transcript_134/g.225  ORF Transcript_134/g.225 Transcript_134/m.225 type:complete len:137 (+) Transcript_134:152-562(+)